MASSVIISFYSQGLRVIKINKDKLSEIKTNVALFIADCTCPWLTTIRSLMTLIARFMGPTWGPSGADRTQVGPMLAPWTLLSGCAGHVRIPFAHETVVRTRQLFTRYSLLDWFVPRYGTDEKSHWHPSTDCQEWKNWIYFIIVRYKILAFTLHFHTVSLSLNYWFTNSLLRILYNILQLLFANWIV